MQWKHPKLKSGLARYSAAVALAGAAQLAGLLLTVPTSISLVTYAPFVVAGGIAGGLGPGMLTTILCVLEAIYFVIEPVGSFAVREPRDWERVGGLLLTGVIASVFSYRLKRSRTQLAEAHRQTTELLDSIHDGFNAFDRQWRYTYVNPAAARMVGRAPQELLGKNLWELWPLAADSPFGAAYRRSMAENVPVQVEAYYGEPLNAWFEVRCYPSPQGLTLFFTETTQRRRTEEQVRLLSSAILQTSDGILIAKSGGDRSWNLQPIFVNSAFERMTGFTLADLQAGALPFLCVEGPSRLEQRMVRQDGSEFWAELTFTPLAKPDGSYTHCVWTCRDVTERKQAAEESRLLACIVECSDDAIIGVSLDGKVLTWNKGAERIFGYSSVEMVGQSVSRLVPIDRSVEFSEILEYLKLGHRIEHLETERIRKDGQRIFVALTISPLRDDSGNIAGASAIARDITERKRAEKSLESSEVRYRSLVRATAQIVWTTDSSGEFVDDVPLWREFTGQSIEEIKGWGRLNALHPNDRERTAALWSRALLDRSVYTTEYRLRRNDGVYRWVTVHGVPVFDEAGQVREWIGTCSDITDRMLAEEEVRQLNLTLEKRVVQRTAEWQAANKELEAFAYSVSHDLRAPLRAVDGFSRILLEEFAPQLPPEAQRYLNIVKENAVQMGNLIDGLLAFSRLSRQPLSRQSVSPAELVRQVLADLSAEQDGRNIEINVSELPLCQADPLLMKQALLNLLSNSLKYTRKCDRARIQVGSFPFADLDRHMTAATMWAPRDLPADTPVYYVRDNGAGFDMRYAAKLFGVFQRLHRAEEYEGTGLGLAIVFRIVTRHGGYVWAEGATNDGATFYFTLSSAGDRDKIVPTPPGHLALSEKPGEPQPEARLVMQQRSDPEGS